jgi:hypothetical protein
MNITTQTKQKIIFALIFLGVGLLALQVPVAQLAGSKAKFTLFDAFGPVASAFVGTIPGVFAVLGMNLGNFLLHGAEVVDTGTMIRFFPMLFAAWYFSRKNPVTLAVPVAAIIVFIAHPIGREVWYYALFWTIPIICHFVREKSLFARALGATFTAHAVGGAAWIWAFDLPARVWQGLIPIVAVERLLFAAGIALSYLLINNIVHVFVAKRHTQFAWMVSTQHVLRQWR